MRIGASTPVGDAIDAANRVGSKTADRAQRDRGVGTEIRIFGSDGGQRVDSDDEDQEKE